MRTLAQVTVAAAWEVPFRWIIVQAAFGRGVPDLALVEARAACGSKGVPVGEAARFRAFGALCLFALGELGRPGRLRSPPARSRTGTALPWPLPCTSWRPSVSLRRPGSRRGNRPGRQHGSPRSHAVPQRPSELQLALANSYIELDRGPDARRTLAAVHKATERTGGAFLPWYHLTNALLAFHTGRWDDALTEVEAGLDPSEHFAMSRALRAVAALISVHRGPAHRHGRSPHRRGRGIRQRNPRLVLRVPAPVRRRPRAGGPRRHRAGLQPARPRLRPRHRPSAQPADPGLSDTRSGPARPGPGRHGERTPLRRRCPGRAPSTAVGRTTSATPTAAKGCWTRTRTCSWKLPAATTQRPDR